MSKDAPLDLRALQQKASADVEDSKHRYDQEKPVEREPLTPREISSRSNTLLPTGKISVSPLRVKS